MNKEAKVGDYIRTKTGIHKVFEIRRNAPMNRYMCDKKSTGEWDGSYEYNLIRVNDIIDVSADIMDLIQVGDYVNGCPVLHKENNELVCGLLLRYKEENIQNVVTKEQFETMQYKVGE